MWEVTDKDGEERRRELTPVALLRGEGGALWSSNGGSRFLGFWRVWVSLSVSV